jgi:hypothetical protein
MLQVAKVLPVLSETVVGGVKDQEEEDEEEERSTISP